jgi:hypothetical protein
LSEFVKKKYITFRYVDAPNGGCWEGREHWEGGSNKTLSDQVNRQEKKSC